MHNLSGIEIFPFYGKWRPDIKVGEILPLAIISKEGKRFALSMERAKAECVEAVVLALKIEIVDRETYPNGYALFGRFKSDKAPYRAEIIINTKCPDLDGIKVYCDVAQDFTNS